MCTFHTAAFSPSSVTMSLWKKREWKKSNSNNSSRHDEIAERYVFICQHVFLSFPFHNQREEVAAATTEAFVHFFLSLLLLKAEAFSNSGKSKNFESNWVVSFGRYKHEREWENECCGIYFKSMPCRNKKSILAEGLRRIIFTWIHSKLNHNNLSPY